MSANPTHFSPQNARKLDFVIVNRNGTAKIEWYNGETREANQTELILWNLLFNPLNRP